MYFDRFEREVKLAAGRGARARTALCSGPRAARSTSRRCAAWPTARASHSRTSSCSTCATSCCTSSTASTRWSTAVRRSPCCRRSSANGHLLLGQNWDWIPEVRGAVLHIARARRPRDPQLHRGGHRRRQNRHQQRRAGPGHQWPVHRRPTTGHGSSTPFHVRCYDILRVAHAGAGDGGGDRHARACSTNFLIAQAPDRAQDLEAAPDAVRTIEPSDAASRAFQPFRRSCRLRRRRAARREATALVQPPGAHARRCSTLARPSPSSTWKKPSATMTTSPTAVPAREHPTIAPEEGVIDRDLGHHGSRGAHAATDRRAAVRAPLRARTRSAHSAVAGR